MTAPVCPKCHGTGGLHARGTWHPCSCRRPTRAQVKAQTAANLAVLADDLDRAQRARRNRLEMELGAAGALERENAT